MLHFPNILHADEHDIVRLGVRALLKQVVPKATVKDVKKNIAIASELQRTSPNLIILECSGSLPDCVALVRDILYRYPQTQIFVFTRHTNALFLSQIVQAGVHGVVLKSEDHHEFEAALRALAQGNIYYSPSVLAKLPNLTIETQPGEH